MTTIRERWIVIKDDNNEIKTNDDDGTRERERWFVSLKTVSLEVCKMVSQLVCKSLSLKV